MSAFTLEYKTVIAFQELMAKYNIVRNDATKTHHIVDGESFFGTYTNKATNRKGTFANLDLVVNGSGDVLEALNWDAQDRSRDGDYHDQTIRIYQRHYDSEIFSITGIDHMDPMSPQSLLGRDLTDFSKLEKLLVGETLRFYAVGRNVDGNSTDDRNRWIEITLKTAV